MSPPEPAVAATGASIAEAISAAECEIARALFVEYATWLAIDLCFQGFGEELATLPGAYARPAGRLFLARVGTDVAGCVALRPLKSPAMPAVSVALESCGRPDSTAPRRTAIQGTTESVAPATACELKRLWVRPGFRGHGLGRALSAGAMRAAREIGYREMKLDTLAEQMPEAVAMYRSLGFVECAPYYHNPVAGVLYMTCALEGS